MDYNMTAALVVVVAEVGDGTVVVEAAPAYKKVVNEYYSLNGVHSNSIIRKYTNEYQKG
jgi:formylmethanofuran dehydrogenase subunit D